MEKIKVIKKLDDYSTDYQVGDILEVTGTWYGGFNVKSKTGIPLSLDKEECEELSETSDLSCEEYLAAANYWKEKDASSVHLDQKVLKNAVETYLTSNNTCALAVSDGSFVRCTPLEYTYHDGAFWIFSEGGEKFRALEKNKQVCLAVFDKYEEAGALKGLQASGKAVLVTPFSKEYEQEAAFRKIPFDALKKLPRPMYLIKIVPEKIKFVNSDFRKENASTRQVYFP